MVAIAVTDRGIGIAPADQQRVFERFFRVDKARSRSTGGTGLGLAIVKHVAANHGGVISLWSKPGTGSTFTLCIPQDMSTEIGWGDDDTDVAGTGIAGTEIIEPTAAVAVVQGETVPSAPLARPKETDR